MPEEDNRSTKRLQGKEIKKTGSFVSFEDETFVSGEGSNDQQIHHKSRMGLGSSQSKITPNFDREEVRSIGIPIRE